MTQIEVCAALVEGLREKIKYFGKTQLKNKSYTELWNKYFCVYYSLFC